MIIRTLTLSALLGILIGCGDKDDDTAPAAEADADTDADTDADPQTTAVIATVSSDYATGSFSTVDLSDWAVEDDLFITSGDSAVSVDEGWVFQINRYGYDNIRLYEPGEWSEPIWEQSLGDLANPYDANLCNGDLFVSLYGEDFIGVYDPASGLLTGTVDLSAFNDGDGVGPEGGGMVEVGGKLYIGMNRLDRNGGWADVGGAVAEIDCESMSVSDSWSIGGNTSVHPWPGTDSVLVTAREFGDDVGGLYAIDTTAGSAELIVETGTDNLSGIAAHGDAAVAISLASDYSHYAVHCIDLADGSLTTVEESVSYLNGVKGNDLGEAWITAASSWIDSSAPSGVFVYDIETCSSLTTDPIGLSLYPLGIAFY